MAFSPFGRRVGPGPAGPRLVTQVQSQEPPRIPSAIIDPVAWLPKQRGQVELWTNVAILAIAAAATVQVTRAPLVVNRPTKQFTAVDLHPNVAANAVYYPRAERYEYVKPKRFAQPEPPPNVAATIPLTQARAATGPEPQFYPRNENQPEIQPNLAAKPAVTEPTTRAPYFMRYFARPFTQIEPPQNVVVRVFVPYSAHGDVYEFQKPPRFWQADTLPNIAIRAPVASGTPRPLIDPPRYPPSKNQPDLPPVLAALPQRTEPILRAAMFMQYRPQRFLQPDLYPGAVFRLSVTSIAPRYLIEPTFYPRWSVASRPEIYPNLAASVELYSQGVDFNDIPVKVRYQVDLFPNLAVPVQAAQVPLCKLLDIQPRTIRWAAPDVYPNISVRIDEYVQSVDFNDLQTRRPRFVELYPNLSIYAATEVVPPFPAEDESYPHRAAAFNAFDVYPNIASAFDNVPIPPTPPDTGGGGGGGRGGGKRHHHSSESDARYKKRDRIKSLLDESLPEVYAELIQGPKQVVAQARAIVQPFKEDNTIDWAVLEADANSVGRLLALVARERSANRAIAERERLQRDDEDWFLMS